MSMESKPTGITWNAGGQTGMARFGEDTNLLVMFYNRPVEIPAESERLGRRFTRDEIYVKIQHPGESLNVIDRPVNESDKNRFRQQWANFLHDRTQVPDGTPIDLLFPNHPSVAENLRAFGVYTVEQCSELSAHAIDSIGRGAQEYVNRAKKYLDMATKGQSFHKLQRENDELRQNVRILESQLNSMQTQVEKLTLKVTDPVRASLRPPFVPDYDVQADRINANQQDVAKRGRPRRSAIEEKITDPLAGTE